MSGRAPAAELVFVWHFHQPDYRSPRAGRAELPWARLHAAKDYLDMARRMEAHPRLRATFNFVPSLVDQIEDAVAGRPDALFDRLARPIRSLEAEEREWLAGRLLGIPPYARERWPELAALLQRLGRGRGAGGRAARLGDRDLVALECWFLVAWADPMFHGEPAVHEALARRTSLEESHRDALLALHARLVAGTLPAWRALAEAGRVELSASAYNHPILPLLAEPESLLRARPDLRVAPETFPMPADAERQVRRALSRHAAAFGAVPAGMWPPEGSVSPEAAAILAGAGVRWIATDEGVLWGSLPAGERRRELLYRPWRFATAAGEIALFFRDHELSDRIGFVYHHWNPEEAAADFVARIERIGEEHRGERPPVVVVILDGENCWEHYAEDGGPFLEALYRRLEASETIRTRTPSDVLADAAPIERLERLHSGSWIDADFHIWMGHPEKNRAWTCLARTRRALDESGATAASHPAAWEHLDAAEGSDWFWWFGDDHFTDDKLLFDRIFREHLQGVHEAIGKPVPAWLQAPIAQRAEARDRAVRPIGILSPAIDGRRTHFYEWSAAGRHRAGAGGSMHRGAGVLKELHYGFDRERLFVRLDFAEELPEALGLRLEFLGVHPQRFEIGRLERGDQPLERVADGRRESVVGARAVVGEILELSLPFAALGAGSGSEVELIVHVLAAGESAEHIPDGDVVRFTVPDAAWEASMWSV